MHQLLILASIIILIFAINQYLSYNHQNDGNEHYNEGALTQLLSNDPYGGYYGGYYDPYSVFWNAGTRWPFNTPSYLYYEDYYRYPYIRYY